MMAAINYERIKERLMEEKGLSGPDAEKVVDEVVSALRKKLRIIVKKV